MSHFSRHHPFPTIKKGDAEKGPWSNKQKEIDTNQIFQEAKYSWPQNLIT